MLLESACTIQNSNCSACKPLRLCDTCEMHPYAEAQVMHAAMSYACIAGKIVAKKVAEPDGKVLSGDL